MPTTEEVESTVTETRTEEPATGAAPKAPAPKQPDATKDPAVTKAGYPEGTKVEDMTLEQQVAYWRSMSRKHENREKANHGTDEDLRSQIESFRQQLAERDVSDARKDVRLAHPEIDDKAMGFCPATDPDAIRKWGDEFSAYLAEHAPASTDTAQPDGRHVPNDTERRLMQHVGTNAASPSAPAKGASNRQSNYEKARAKYSPAANK